MKLNLIRISFLVFTLLTIGCGNDSSNRPFNPYKNSSNHKNPSTHSEKKEPSLLPKDLSKNNLPEKNLPAKDEPDFFVIEKENRAPSDDELNKDSKNHVLKTEKNEPPVAPKAEKIENSPLPSLQPSPVRLALEAPEKGETPLETSPKNQEEISPTQPSPNSDPQPAPSESRASNIKNEAPKAVAPIAPSAPLKLISKAKSSLRKILEFKFDFGFLRNFSIPQIPACLTPSRLSQIRISSSPLDPSSEAPTRTIRVTLHQCVATTRQFLKSNGEKAIQYAEPLAAPFTSVIQQTVSVFRSLGNLFHQREEVRRVGDLFQVRRQLTVTPERQASGNWGVGQLLIKTRDQIISIGVTGVRFAWSAFVSSYRAIVNPLARITQAAHDDQSQPPALESPSSENPSHETEELLESQELIEALEPCEDNSESIATRSITFDLADVEEETIQDLISSDDIEGRLLINSEEGPIVIDLNLEPKQEVISDSN